MVTLKRYRISDDNIPGVLYYESNAGRLVAMAAESMLRSAGYKCTAEVNEMGTWRKLN